MDLIEDRFQSVGELISAVRDDLTHRDSIAIATLAESDLGRARLSKEPNDYAKTRFRFEEALQLWDQNKLAKAGLKSVQVEIATHRVSVQTYGNLGGSI